MSEATAAAAVVTTIPTTMGTTTGTATATAGTTTVVFITGANSGIGFDTAARLATARDARYHVVLGVRSLDKGRQAVADIRARIATAATDAATDAAGTAATATPLTLVQIDVLDPPSVRAAAARVAAELGRVDVLINNAGVHLMSPAIDLATRLRDTFATNSTGPAIVTDAFAPLLMKSADPRLLYVSSLLGSIGEPRSWAFGGDGLPYRMSKAALNMLTAYHHREFADWGCKVWAISPGYVLTNLGGEEGRAMAIAKGAASSETSAAFIESVIQGKRDADAGKFIHKDGVNAW